MCSGVSGLHTTVIRVRMRRENTLPSNVPGATMLTPTVCSSSTAGINHHHAFLTTALPDRLLHHAHPGVSNVIAVTSYPSDELDHCHGEVARMARMSYHCKGGFG